MRRTPAFLMLALAGCSSKEQSAPLVEESYGVAEVVYTLPDAPTWLRGDETALCWRVSSGTLTTACVPMAGGAPSYFADWVITDPVQLLGGRVFWFARTGDSAAPLVAYVDSSTTTGADRRRALATTPPLQAFALHASGVYGLREGRLLFAPMGSDPAKPTTVEGVADAVKISAGDSDLVVVGTQAWHIPLTAGGPGKPTLLGGDVSSAAGGVAVGGGVLVALDGAGVLTVTTLGAERRSLGFTALPTISGSAEVVIRGDRVFVSGVSAARDRALLYSCRITPGIGDCKQVDAASQTLARGPVGVVATNDAVYWAAEGKVLRYRRIRK